MAFTPGGRADKFGNHYESQWVAFRLLDLLAEKIRSVTVEAIGELEIGTDLWVEDFDGFTSAEQCKARNGSQEKWSISDLHEVISKIPIHLHATKCKEFSLVTPLPFTLLSDLCEDARNSENAETFHSALVSTSKDKIKIYSQFAKALKLDEKNNLDREKIYQCFKLFKVNSFVGFDGSMDTLVHRAQFMFNGKPELVISLLRNYVIDSKMLGKKITNPEIINYLERNGIRSKKLIGDDRLTEKLKALNEDFSHSISSLLINGKKLHRDQTQECFDKLENSEILVIHGEAGKGKSGVLFELTELLIENSIPYLAVRLDRKIPQGSAEDFGKTIGLPDSPSIALAKYVGQGKCVLILDQLDAIRWTSSKSLEGIDICKQLVNQALRYNDFEEGSVRIIISCRTFDLENDPEIKAWLSDVKFNERIKKIEIQALSDAEIEKLVGIDFKTLSSAQKRILSIPQNLYMWLDLNKNDPVSFSGAADLMKKFWDFKRAQIEKMGIRSEAISSVLEKIVSYLDSSGAVSAPERVLNGQSIECINALMSHSIIQFQDKKVTFCHQSYLDFLIAMNVFEQIDQGKPLLQWLGDKENQTLYRRQALSLFLMMLLTESQELFVKHFRETIFSDNVRFHVKHLFLEILGQAVGIGREIKELENELLESEHWKNHVLPTSIIGKPELCKHLVNGPLLRRWISSGLESDVQNSLWIIRSIIKELPDECEGFLRFADQNEFASIDKIYNTLDFHISSDTQSLLAFRLELISKGAVVNFVDWKELAEKSPNHAIELIGTLSEVHRKVRKGNNDGCRLYGDDMKEILKIVAKIPIVVFEKFLASATESLITHNAREYRSSFSSFDIEKSYQSRNTELDNFEDLTIILTIESGKKLAQTQPEVLISHLEAGPNQPSLPDNMKALMMSELPLKYADYVLTWLENDPARLSIGLGFQRPQWMLAADLLKKFSSSCQISKFKSLETKLYSYTTKDPESIRLIKWRLEARTKYGDDFPIWGEAQYFLLPSLDPNRISVKTKNLIDELKRKFSKYPIARFYSELGSRGGWIGSKLDSNCFKISTKSWVKIITNSKTPKSHNHSSWEQTDDENILVSSHDTFAGTLEKAAKNNPGKFCKMFLGLSQEIDNSYVSSMLRSLTMTKKETGTSTEDDTLWEKADVAAIELFWEHFRHKRTDRNIAMAFCSMIQKRNDEQWSDFIINDLMELATRHSSPILDDEKVENYTPEKLYGITINSVRSSATEALGALLWERPELLTFIEPTIQAISKDEHPAVLMAISSVAQPILNIDKPKAIELFVDVGLKDLRIPCTHQSVDFINYSISTKNEKLLILIRKMLQADEYDEVVQLASEMVTFYSQCQSGILDNEFELALDGTQPQRMGVARAAKNLIKNNINPKIGRSIVLRYFNDTDLEVRKRVSRIFNEDGFLDSTDNFDLAIAFIKSKAFLDSDFEFFRCLLRYKGNILEFKDLILDACERIMNDKKIKNETITSLVELKDIVSLLIRLYEQASKDPVLTGRCLDIWDLFFESNFGSTRELTQLISR